MVCVRLLLFFSLNKRYYNAAKYHDTYDDPCDEIRLVGEKSTADIEADSKTSQEHHKAHEDPAQFDSFFRFHIGGFHEFTSPFAASQVT
jgi:hypothetical protein